MRHRLLGVGMVAAVLVGCGGGSDRPAARSEPRAVTTREAGVLADVLHRNFQAGGAHFVATATIDGAPVRLDGAVSWADHAGSGFLSVGAVSPYEVRWTADAVFRALPGLPERMAAQGRPAVRWVVFPADPQNTRLDVVIALLVGLAATTSDNPVNVQQQSDVQWLGADTVDTEGVDVFRKGRIELYVARSDSMLRRVLAQLAFTDDRLRVDVTGFGPQPFAIPPAEQIVDGRDIPEIYAELTQLSVI
ncbi:MAG: hypothetical protein QOH36_268 [Actinomycetota bacterium]|nr:hypothetical protein [Actinomycetota bacterium]